MFATTTSRKVLVPFATLVAAGAVAIGSGATFNSTTGSSITAEAGTLLHINSDTGATLDISNLKPGDSQTGTLTITNDGSLDSTLKVIASAPSGGLGELASALQLTIEGQSESTGFDGNFEDADNAAAGYGLGLLDADKVDVNGDPVDDFITVTVTVEMEDNGLAEDAETGDLIDNAFQGASAGLSLSFVTTQTDDAEAEQTGWDADEDAAAETP